MFPTRYNLIPRTFVNSFLSDQRVRRSVFIEHQNVEIQRNSNVLFVDQPNSSASFADQQGSKNSNSKKRKITDSNDNRDEYAPPRPLRRIFENYFPLTRTHYKYLKIGINLTMPSRVEIALGDAHNREITLTFEIWKSILDNRDVILRFFDIPVNWKGGGVQIRIEYLTLSFGKIKNLRILRMETPTHRLAMSRDTVQNMFALECHINHIFQSLNKITATVDAKLSRFLAIIADIKNPVVAQAIREHPSFDKNDSIDSELFAQIFAV